MFILGFTDEDVTGGWQHWRLATECGSAFEEDGLPTSFGVSEGPGEGKYLIQWYIRPDAAAVLDRHGVGWRRFLIAERASPPGPHSALLPSTTAQRLILEERKPAGGKY